MAGPMRAAGIIPAYAGSTPSTSGQVGGDADHPRIRGEHKSTYRYLHQYAGSSPHTRGARRRHRRQPTRRPIIPAYAGSTRRGSWRVRFCSDHPRIRGEHRRHDTETSSPYGSSPHTRGAQVLGDDLGVYLGIIPAYAGSTNIRSRRIRRRKDHPRIRGEHEGLDDAAVDSVGSSPHTRGARDLVGVAGINPGIIPAYAGSTAGPANPTGPDPDHPRIRGEHRGGNVEMTSRSGSSPHTRGAHQAGISQSIGSGIIPAYAGSTGAPVGRSGSVGDHPRIRGEHSSRRPARVRSAGSSPHTRGALD